jgi:Ser/Thr protein kinase RdoA (MazF antagonist)
MKKKKDEETKPLTQEELKAWWPFTRLDPNRMPKKTKPEPEKFEDALL